MTTAGDAASLSLKRNGNFRRLWLGQAVSITGDYVFDTTVVLWIGTVIARGKPWAPAAVGGVLIAAAVPALVVGPFAGVFVDRWNRRRTMLVADACRCVLIAGLLVLAAPAVAHRLSTLAQIGIIYAVVAAASCFSQFFAPSRLAMIGAVVPEADRARASGLFQATASFATIIGPPLAAPLLFVFGVQWALIINAASFAVSFATIRAIRLAPAPAQAAGQQPPASFRREFQEGIRFFARSRVLVALSVGVIVATLGSGALSALNVFFVIHNLHVRADWLGTLTAAEGAGAVAGALVAGWIAARIGTARVFVAGLFLAGIAEIGYSRTTLLPVAIGVMACAGIIFGAVNTAIMPLVLRAVPQHMLGRVLAVITPMQFLAGILSMAVSGFLASTVLRGFHQVIAGVTFGTYDTIFAIAGLLFIAGGLASIAPLRGVTDTVSEPEAAVTLQARPAGEPEAGPAHGSDPAAPSLSGDDPATRR